MKITELSQIKRLATPATPDAAPSGAAERSGGADRISTDDSARVAAVVSAAQENAGSGRTAKLRAIETAVRQGTYRPDPQRIAQEILDDAELAARLQALFRK
jgi:negative regulator of flagellin synthesis FlgM